MTRRPIPILYFTSATARGGAEEHILTLLRGLDRDVFRATLVCPQVLITALGDDLPKDVRLVPLCLRKPSQIGAAIHLARILHDEKIEILHSHIFYSSLFASPIGWLTGVPVIVETPHLRECWRKSWLKSKFFVDRIIGRFVDYYIAVSDANARYLIEQKLLPQEKILTIHNGTDLERFDPEHRPPAGLRESLGFNSNDPIFLVAGRLEPQKGHGVLLDAWPLVLQQFPSARLVCLGEGRLLPDLQARAGVLGIEASVHFLGRRSDIQDWFAISEATILPSFWEGLPLVAIESLAAGRAVIATDVDGTPEVVIDGKTGLLVPPGNNIALAEAIVRLLREPTLRQRLASQGREWVVSHFDKAQQVRQTQEFYLRAVENARGGVARTQVALHLHNPSAVKVPIAGQKP